MLTSSVCRFLKSVNGSTNSLFGRLLSSTSGGLHPEPLSLRWEDPEIDPSPQELLEYIRENHKSLSTVSMSIPDSVTDSEWRHLAACPTNFDLLHFMNSLCGKVAERLAVKAKQERRTEEEEQKLIEERDNYMRALSLNPYAPHLAGRARFFAHRQCLATEFGPRIVIDCEYQRRRVLKQLASCVGRNKSVPWPSKLYLAGFDPATEIVQRFYERIYQEATGPHNYPPLAVEFRAEPLEEIFPRESIVYLSPESPNLLDTVSPDMVYVVGAIVDKPREQPGLTLGKAEMLGVKTARLPLVETLGAEITGSLFLPLELVILIILERFVGKPWDQTLKGILPPTRKSSRIEDRQTLVWEIEDYLKLKFGFLAGRLPGQIMPWQQKLPQRQADIDKVLNELHDIPS